MPRRLAVLAGSRTLRVGICSTTIVFAASVLGAPQGASSRDTLEEVVVTGTYLERSVDELPSPVSVLGEDEIVKGGRTTLAEVFKTLPINTGSFAFGDPVAQRFSSGANLDLRGLGPASTLVLLNGRRQTNTAIPNQDGTSFVDVNSLVPPIMVERVEVIKDGASALYGSDAVAGTANFITRNNFEGAEFDVGYSAAAGDSDEITIGAIFGTGNDSSHIVFAASYLDRSHLNVEEFPDSFPFLFTSGGGQPGSYFLLPGQTYNPPYDAFPPGTPIIDPACGSEALGGFPEAGVPRNPANTAPAEPGGVGLCRMLTSVETAIIPDQRRTQLYVTGHTELSPAVELFGEGGFTRDRVTRGSSSSFAFLGAPGVSLMTIPAENPGNFFGGTVQWFGRPLGLYNADTVQKTENDTYRGVLGFRGDLGSRWSWEISASYSENRARFQWLDSLRDRLQAALNGVGGPNNNEFFNPFGGAVNSRSVVDDFFVPAVLEAESSLASYEALIRGNLMELSGGPLGIAIGAQYRSSDLSGNWDDNMNRGRFAFITIPTPDFSGKQDVRAAFFELGVPVLPSLNLQLATRYESYGNDVDTVDPKIAVRWQPLEQLTLRASWGTSFAAPTVFQQVGTLTSTERVRDPLIPGAAGIVAPPVATRGNRDLEPYDSTNYNIELVWTPLDALRLSLAYWNFDIEDIIVPTPYQQLANSTDPNVNVREPPGTGTIVTLNGQFINAAGIEADGLDLTGDYTLEIGRYGSLNFSTAWTYVLSYDYQIAEDQPVVDGVGLRSFNTFAAPQPEVRGTATIRWNLGPHEASISGRYIDSLINTDPASAPPAANCSIFNPDTCQRVGSFTTVDVQYSFTLEDWFGKATRFTIGANNVFDKDPPYMIQDNLGYDGRIHDGRRRIVYARVNQSF
jgi:outer membrane receptor protein involved in Fe transport